MDEDRLVNIEMALANMQKTIDDLNDEVVRHSREISSLLKECKLLRDMLKDDSVKPLSEETPPPHY